MLIKWLTDKIMVRVKADIEKMVRVETLATLASLNQKLAREREAVKKEIHAPKRYEPTPNIRLRDTHLG